MRSRNQSITTLLALGITLVLGMYIGRAGHSEISLAQAAGDDSKDAVRFLPDASPTKARPATERQAYFPGTEDMDPNEMRIIASIEDLDVIKKILRYLRVDQPGDSHNHSPWAGEDSKPDRLVF